MGGNPDLITAIMDRSLLLTILYLRSTVTVASCLAMELLQGPLIFLKTLKESVLAIVSPYGRNKILLWLDKEGKTNYKMIL